jgi:CRP-like cAMP-binding protein
MGPREKMKADLQKLLERRSQLVTQIKEFNDRLAELNLAISLLSGESEAPSTEPPRRRRHVKATVMELISASGQTGVTAAEIVEQARSRGRELDRPSVSSLLSKLKADGVLTFDGERYFQASSPNPEPSKFKVVS